VLHLKDLLTVLPPSRVSLFENVPVFKALFWGRIVPKAAIFCQNRAEYGRRSTLFATGFLTAIQGLRLGAHPASAERQDKNGRREG